MEELFGTILVIREGIDAIREIKGQVDKIVQEIPDFAPNRILDIANDLAIYVKSKFSDTTNQFKIEDLKDANELFSNWAQSDDTFANIYNRLVPTYGLWGGPMWSMGRRNTYAPYTYNEFIINTPIDELDALCSTHDLQYSFTEIPSIAIIADKILVRDAEKLLKSEQWKNNNYLKYLIMVFKERLRLLELNNGQLNATLEEIELYLPNYELARRYLKDNPSAWDQQTQSFYLPTKQKLLEMYR